MPCFLQSDRMGIAEITSLQPCYKLYWAFTLTDGALRMLVVLHFHQLGYSPLEIAMEIADWRKKIDDRYFIDKDLICCGSLSFDILNLNNIALRVNY